MKDNEINNKASGKNAGNSSGDTCCKGKSNCKNDGRGADAINMEINMEDDDSCITVVCEDDESTLHKRHADEMTAAAQRIKAEFDNYRKRTLEQSRQSREDGRAEVIEKLLPALDSFTQAMKIIKDKSVLEGIELIYGQLKSVLSGFGLTRVDALGQEFDPVVMNAVMMRQEKGKSGKVVEVILDGYTINGKALRPATVIVGE